MAQMLPKGLDPHRALHLFQVDDFVHQPNLRALANNNSNNSNSNSSSNNSNSTSTSTSNSNSSNNNSNSKNFRVGTVILP